jgi:hypothetical protein
VTLTRHVAKEGETYHGQNQVERECFGIARNFDFDWALPIDVDEYLLFQQRLSIQEFLPYYEAQNITYISLGKHHYLTRHIVDSHNTTATTTSATSSAGSWFGVEQYPFTPGPYCYRRPGQSRCPTWMGRCKVLASFILSKSMKVNLLTMIE